jgi:hypothetical protein
MEIIDSFEFVHNSCIFPGKDILSSPLDQVLQLAPKLSTIQDFFYFISGLQSTIIGPGTGEIWPGRGSL